MARPPLTKEQIGERLRQLKQQRWIRSLRPLNAGGIGNTIDHLLGLPMSNLPISDTAQWELKTHRIGTSSLVTLFHMEPEPKHEHIVPRVLLPYYGWPDQKRPDELSFRQTLNATQFTDRGFRVHLDRPKGLLKVDFDSTRVAPHHKEWVDSVGLRRGLGPLSPQPYWNVKDLALKVSTKMLNCFLVNAETKRSKDEEYFRIHSVLTLQGFSTNGFMDAVEQGAIYVDFDARTRHNHGTKFRLRDSFLPTLYAYVDQVL